MPWLPPEPADPSLILRSAQDDATEGRHADALAKFLWFHHNALRYDPCQAGVRLSYALAAWLRLGEQYPPARAAFLRTRDETEAALAADPANFGLFHDFACLNRTLGDGPRTADVFAATAEWDPVAAIRLYPVAEPYLVAAGRFAECGQFLDPPARLRDAGEKYQVLTECEARKPTAEGSLTKVARLSYTRNVATLVGLLVLNRRPDDAAWVRERALTVLDDEEFRAQLDAAMGGRLPPSGH